MAPGVLVSDASEAFEKYAIIDTKKVEVVDARRSYNLPVKSLLAFWQTEPHELHDYRSTEQLPEHSDIVIIGAGYAGVSVAHHLATDPAAVHKSITMLEARGACSGATGRNGGHMRPDLYSHIAKYCDLAGVDAGVEVAEFEISHVQSIKKLVDEEKIDCDFTLTRSFDVWCNETAAKAAHINYEGMRARKLQYMDDVVFYTGKNVEGICGVRGAVACSSYTAGTIWPYKFVLHFIAKLVSSMRINLQTHTPVTVITPSATGGYDVTTSRGTIHASEVIHANNGYIGGLLPEYENSIVPCKGICCRITVPEGSMAPLLNNSYIERTKDNILSYLIPRADGSIIVGGASQIFRPHLEQWYGNTDDSNLIDAAKDYYEGYMQRTFRGWEESGAKVDRIWTGIMGYSCDDLPHVGEVPGRPGQFLLGGWNGHGMPVVWRCGAAIAQMVAQGSSFEETGVPKLFKTTQERLDFARYSREGSGNILKHSG